MASRGRRSPSRRRRRRSARREYIDPLINGRASLHNGRTNGLVLYNGRTNGRSSLHNGRTNGRSSLHNGRTNGRASLHNGRTNGRSSLHNGRAIPNGRREHMSTAVPRGFKGRWYDDTFDRQLRAKIYSQFGRYPR
jgi:hypothetical protein